MKTLSHKLAKQQGFTLLEILMVIALLSVVITFLAKNIFPQFSRGKVDAAKIQMRQLDGDLDRYRLDCNRYPTTAQGLNALLQAPDVAPTCQSYDPAGYYSGKAKAIKDVWGGPFKYLCEDGINYEIISLGADAKEGGEGENADISSKDL
ncbi:MAG TPA: type II secretion system major pseudopilin GspG [Bdellovibrionota bacterium]|nr:type II secretion system major pseudopilin GspG [Bdellovibrionota bacterium]